jgi:hypothetical protein
MRLGCFCNLFPGASTPPATTIKTALSDDVLPPAEPGASKVARPNELLVFSCENRRRRSVLTARQMIDIKKRPHLPLEDKLSPVSVSYLLLPQLSISVSINEM